MDGSKKAGLAEQVRRFRARFVQSRGAALGKVITAHVLKSAVLEETGLLGGALNRSSPADWLRTGAPQVGRSRWRNAGWGLPFLTC